jgi:hypothetical protein
MTYILCTLLSLALQRGPGPTVLTTLTYPGRDGSTRVHVILRNDAPGCGAHFRNGQLIGLGCD